MHEAAFSFQSGFMDEHDAVSEVLNPGEMIHIHKIYNIVRIMPLTLKLDYYYFYIYI